jgi:hypothetical protein
LATPRSFLLILHLQNVPHNMDGDSIEFLDVK